jgi:CheY-like chemotaxis protein
MEFDIVIINKNQLSVWSIEKLIAMKKKQNFKIVVLSDLFSSINNKILRSIPVDTYLKTPFNQQNILNMIVDLYVSKKLDSRSRLTTSKNLLQDVGDKKILIAEDNEVNHKVISGLMAQTGIELTYVYNGREAVETLLGGQKFDLVLMDISMPIMNGFEATKEIRKHKRFDELPILALTADVMDEAINKAISSGMQGHISKPISIDIFYKKIYDVFTGVKKKEKSGINQNFELEKLDSEYEEI